MSNNTLASWLSSTAAMTPEICAGTYQMTRSSLGTDVSGPSQSRARTNRRELSSDNSCVVVSTTLIEAGVDLDFPVVYRASRRARRLRTGGGPV